MTFQNYICRYISRASQFKESVFKNEVNNNYNFFCEPILTSSLIRDPFLSVHKSFGSNPLQNILLFIVKLAWSSIVLDSACHILEN